MKGAIIGDIFGSIYEEIPNNVNKRQDLTVTDDSILTFACHDWIKSVDINDSVESLRYQAKSYLVSWYNEYTVFGFSPRFSAWAEKNENLDYGQAQTNGCLMRQSPIVAYSCDNNLSLERCVYLAKVFASVTHNSDLAMKSVERHVHLLYSALTNGQFNVDKPVLNIKQWRHVTKDNFIWDAKTSLDIALSCIYYANSFEQTIDNCIAVGADTDTYASIAGPIAQALWSINSSTLNLAYTYLSDEKLKTMFKDMQ